MSAGAASPDLTGLKIVIMVGTFVRGGCERQAFLLARELIHRHGLNAEVWALKFPGEYSREFEAAGNPHENAAFQASAIWLGAALMAGAARAEEIACRYPATFHDLAQRRCRPDISSRGRKAVHLGRAACRGRTHSGRGTGCGDAVSPFCRELDGRC